MKRLPKVNKGFPLLYFLPPRHLPCHLSSSTTPRNQSYTFWKMSQFRSIWERRWREKLRMHRCGSVFTRDGWNISIMSGAGLKKWIKCSFVFISCFIFYDNTFPPPFVMWVWHLRSSNRAAGCNKPRLTSHLIDTAWNKAERKARLLLHNALTRPLIYRFLVSLLTSLVGGANIEEIQGFRKWTMRQRVGFILSDQPHLQTK